MEGIGLGLTISKQIINQIGPAQEIECKSEPGVGSTIKFRVFSEVSIGIDAIRNRQISVLNKG